jgi:nitroreductase
MVTVGDQPERLVADWVLTTTRSVRKGLDTTREVPRELIEDCLRVAMQAPGASNTLYPHFVVVTDPAKRAAVAGFYKRAWDAYLSNPRNVQFEDPIHEAQMPRVVASAAYLRGTYVGCSPAAGRGQNHHCRSHANLAGTQRDSAERGRRSRARSLGAWPRSIVGVPAFALARLERALTPDWTRRRCYLLRP